MREENSSCLSVAPLTLMYLLVRCFVAMTDLLHWPRWDNPLSPWRGGPRLHLQPLIDSPWRILRGGEERQIEDEVMIATETRESRVLFITRGCRLKAPGRYLLLRPIPPRVMNQVSDMKVMSINTM